MSLQSIEDACRTACETIGVAYKSVPADGEFHRADLADDSKGRNDASIKIFPDRQGGIAWNHKSGQRETFFVNDRRYGLGEPLSQAEHERIQRERLKCQAEQTRKQEKAAGKARTLWEAAKPAPPDHPYLARKQIKPHGLRIGRWERSIETEPGKFKRIVIENSLILPMYDQTGVIRSLQGIFAEKHPELERDKDFLPGGGMVGLFWWIGAKTEKVLLAEGFATAATLHEESGYRVYVTFTANNLLAVGRIVREKLPDAEIIFAADNDTKTPGNPGLTKATEAAQAVGGSVAVPPIHGDFNDYGVYLKGLDHDTEG